MVLISDTAEAVRWLLGHEAEMVRTDAEHLAGVAGEAWRAITASAEEPTSGRSTPRPLCQAAVSGELAALGGPILVQGYTPRSQFVRLQELAAQRGSLPDGLACLALDGARFQGQRGRSWSTHRGNLHLSVHLALDLPAEPVQAGLSVLPAVAAARAIEAVSASRVLPRFKWVNDLLLDHGKVGGVLTAGQVQAGRVRNVIVGVGLNLLATPSLPAGPRVLPAARLADYDPVFAGEDGWAKLLQRLLHELAEARRALATGGSEPLLDAYRQRAAFLGRNVSIWPVEEAVATGLLPIAQGRVLELLPDLSLLIEGYAEPVRHGRMTIEEELSPG